GMVSQIHFVEHARYPLVDASYPVGHCPEQCVPIPVRFEYLLYVPTPIWRQPHRISVPKAYPFRITGNAGAELINGPAYMSVGRVRRRVIYFHLYGTYLADPLSDVSSDSFFCMCSTLTEVGTEDLTVP